MAEQVTDTVGQEHLKIVRNEIGVGWMKLARELGIADSVIETLSVDLIAYGIGEMTHHALNKWVQEKGQDATVTALQASLKRMGRNDISDKLSKASSAPAAVPPARIRTSSKPTAGRLTWKHKKEVSVNIHGESWRHLGESLGFLPSHLNNIQESSKGVQESCRKMLDEWVERGAGDRSELVCALRGIDCNEIANTIEVMD